MKKMILILMLLSLFIVVGCSSLFPGIVIFSKEPDAPKPSDFFYCEIDEDCGVTSYEDGGCCTGCPSSMNKVAVTYLTKWHELNCPKGIAPGCLILECPISKNIRCENNRCIGDLER